MIDNLHLKVELSNEDMQNLEINRSSFLEKSDRAKLVLKAILKRAAEQTGFDVFSSHLLIEIFLTVNEGCLMLFTRSPKRKKVRYKLVKKIQNQIFLFEKIENFFSFCEKINFSDFNAENSLYLYNDKYYFYISLNKSFAEKCKLLLSEYSARPVKIRLSFLKEHATLLSDNIIAKIKIR